MHSRLRGFLLSSQKAAEAAFGFGPGIFRGCHGPPLGRSTTTAAIGPARFGPRRGDLFTGASIRVGWGSDANPRPLACLRSDTTPRQKFPTPAFRRHPFHQSLLNLESMIYRGVAGTRAVCPARLFWPRDVA